MKKFNADGGSRKDIRKDFNQHDLNSYSGKSLEDAKKTLDDTTILSEEELNEIKSTYNISTEEDKKIDNKYM